MWSIDISRNHQIQVRDMRKCLYPGNRQVIERNGSPIELEQGNKEEEHKQGRNKGETMPSELLIVHPNELKFPFELKKKISFSLRLVNVTEDHVAFKVKTTSPKKYCVHPNTGVVFP
jgi:hypothetical protein